MTMCEEPIQKNNVIAGPWKARPKREVILQDEKIIEDQENAMFCDTLTEGLLIQMINTIDENGFETNTENFLRDMGWIIESVRSTLYREMDLEHPMSELIREFTKEVEPEEKQKSRHFILDIGRLGDTLKRFQNEDEDEKETE